MTKLIKGKISDNVFAWITIPDVGINSKNRVKKLGYLDIFYSAAQQLINKEEKSEEKISATKKRILIELNNKLVKLDHLVKEIKKQRNKILKRKWEKNVYDYKPYQILIGTLESYLDTIHSISDYIKLIDEALGNNFGKQRWKEKWFQLNIDLRNLFHHIESPICSVERKKVKITFERVNELNNPLFFKNTQKNTRFTMIINDSLGDDIINFLEEWAKKYLKLLDPKTEIEIIYKFEKDNLIKSKKIKLKDIYKKNSLNI